MHRREHLGAAVGGGSSRSTLVITHVSQPHLRHRLGEPHRPPESRAAGAMRHAQYAQFRVHTSPRIMNVARFVLPALADVWGSALPRNTVWSFKSRIMCFRAT